jgi:hypothetical protein
MSVIDIVNQAVFDDVLCRVEKLRQSTSSHTGTGCLQGDQVSLSTKNRPKVLPNLLSVNTNAQLLAGKK